MILISVVIPIYNVRDYLRRCLDSLYCQIGQMIEVILVNDGSTDDSLYICKEYAGKYMNTIVIDKDNGGLSDARNVGTCVATGKYVYYLDSDDWLAPNAIGILLDFAIKYDCEIVQGGFYYAHENFLLYDKSCKQSQVMNKGRAMLELIKNNYVKNFAWGKLYRADIVKKHQFPKGRYFEDVYWQHLMINECVHYGLVPLPLYYYRQRRTGISGSFSLKNIDYLYGYEKRMKFVESYYPEYINLMAIQLWNQSYLMLSMAKRCGDKETEKSFVEYWNLLNLKYNNQFKIAMGRNLRYRTVKRFPSFMPFWDFVYRVYNRFQPSLLTKEKIR